jgi:L-2-hydroxyglutarate oxidase LhgO
MSDKLDCVVIGAGVVGLAIARSFALAGREVVVLEAEPQVGSHSSSRNSEVIHAGLYYPEDSLKARLCVSGKEALYRYCEEHQVSFSRIGKLVVASTVDDVAKLHMLNEQAIRNGVTDLRLLTQPELVALEPEVVGEAALLSPSTGIIDSHGLMLALQGEIEANGGMVVCNSEVTSVAAVGGGFQLEIGGSEDDSFSCRSLVNAAGLWARGIAVSLLSGWDRGVSKYSECQSKTAQSDKLGPLLQVGPVDLVPVVCFAKGHYFSYQGKSPFRHLIYPLPFGGGLGIHATNDLSGATRFGPDVTWVDEIDYEFDESRKADFIAAIRPYFPGLDEERLVPAYTGIRPKLDAAGELAADFVIQGEGDHGVPGLVNLYGIESPGLTASMAIGDYVQKLLP